MAQVVWMGSKMSATISYPSVTIVMPTRNGREWLSDSLDLFVNQDYPGDFELLVFDTESTDGTVDLLLEHKSIRVVNVRVQDFGHGKTRNRALDFVQTPLVLFTVQDAKPRDLDWLQRMVDVHLRHEVDAVCGGQAVERNLKFNPWEWYLDSDLKQPVRVLRHEQFATADVQAKVSACNWDNVNALYRLDALKAVPFRDVQFGEDLAWALDALSHGFHIAYFPEGAMIHYHRQNRAFVRDRVFATAKILEQVFGKEVLALPNVVVVSAGRKRSFQKLRLISRHLGFLGVFALPRWVFYNFKIRSFKSRAIKEYRRGLNFQVTAAVPLAPGRFRE